MRFQFNHPVMARALTKGTLVPCLAVGTVETEIEIPEFDASDLMPAFVFGDTYNKPIFAHGGKLWRKSKAKLKDYAENGFEALADIVNHDICQPFGDFRTELLAAAGARDMPALPKPTASMLERVSEWMDVVDYLNKAGPISRRRVVDMEEADIEAWRERMRVHLSAFAYFDGQAYEVCHEPMITVSHDRIVLRDASYLQHFANQRKLTAHRLPETMLSGMNPELHMFPADRGDEALEFAERTLDGEANASFFSVTCHGYCSSLEEVVERDTVRFSSLHIDYASQIEQVVDIYPHQETPGARDYVRAVATLADTARAYVAETAEHSDLDRALQHATSLASRVDHIRYAVGRARDKEALITHTERHFTRVDELTVSLDMPYVPPSRNPT